MTPEFSEPSGTEIVVVSAADDAALVSEMKRLVAFIDRVPDVRLVDVAYTCSLSTGPAVVAMIFTAGLKILIPAVFPNGFSNLGVSDVNIRAGIFFLAGLVLLRKFKLSPIKVMLGCGVAELAVRTVLLLL